MSRPDCRDEWVKLLKEPVAAVARVRFIRGNTGEGSPLLRGTVVLTESRFLVYGGGFFSVKPGTQQKLLERLKIQFPRTNITEVEPMDGLKDLFTLRYIDGKERKISFRPGKEGRELIKLMEQDLSGG